MLETWSQSLGWEDSPGEWKGYTIQYSGLENSIDYSSWGHKELDTTFTFAFTGYWRVLIRLGVTPSLFIKCHWVPTTWYIARTSLVAQTVNLCEIQRPGFNLWIGKFPWRREWQPTLVFLPENSMDRGAVGLQSMWSQRVGHDWGINTFIC